MCDECPGPLDGVFEYRVEYRTAGGYWECVVGENSFDTEAAAEAHLNYLSGHVYDEKYRITRRLMPGWEEVK